MKNMKTRAKLISGFGIVAILLVVVGILSIYGLTNLKEVSDVISDNYMNASQAAGEIDSNIISQLSIIRGMYVNFDDQATIDEYTKQLEGLYNSVDGYMKEYATACEGITTNAGSYVSAFDSLYHGEYSTFMNDAVILANGDDAEALRQLIIEKKQLCADLEDYLAEIVELADSDSNVYNAAANKTADRLMMIVIVIAVVAVVASIAIGLYTSSLIAKPLAQLSSSAKEVSEGNIDIEVENDRRDEIGDLANSFSDMIHAIKAQSEFIDTVSQGDYRSEIPVRSDKDTMNKALNKMVESNNEMIAKIRMSSEQVSSASTQIAQAAQTLASGSTEQAASVDEFTSTLNDVLEQTNKNAQLSIQALENVNEAVQYMGESSALMEELLGAMQSIDESSQNITKVIKTIEDIAFQTNILALNAAVEAAHAGQHGRGFAVVAEEVRSLASDSSVAAKETAELIENSAARVKEGNELVSKTSECMNNVATSAAKVHEAINFIAEASQQQAVAISELHQGLEQISQVVQANSATSQQTAASAEEMSSQAAMLDETVSEFKLSDKYDKRLGSGVSYSAPKLSSSASSYEESYSSPSDFGKY